MADVCHAFHLSCAWPYAKAAKVALDGWCRCVYVEVRRVERCSRANDPRMPMMCDWRRCSSSQRCCPKRELAERKKGDPRGPPLCCHVAVVGWRCAYSARASL